MEEMGARNKTSDNLVWSPLEIEQSLRLCVLETVKSLQKRLWAIDFFGARPV
jgi:hypothetical protein